MVAGTVSRDVAVRSTRHDDAVLWVHSTNERARHFYERQGRGCDGTLRVQQFGGAVVIDHRMSRRIRPS